MSREIHVDFQKERIRQERFHVLRNDLVGYGVVVSFIDGIGTWVVLVVPFEVCDMAAKMRVYPTRTVEVWSAIFRYISDKNGRSMVVLSQSA